MRIETLSQPTFLRPHGTHDLGARGREDLETLAVAVVAMDPTFRRERERGDETTLSEKRGHDDQAG